jgi:hypothetical protein
MGSRFQGMKRRLFLRSRGDLGAGRPTFAVRAGRASPRFAATTGRVDGHRGIGCESEGLAAADVMLAPEKGTG